MIPRLENERTPLARRIPGTLHPIAGGFTHDTVSQSPQHYCFTSYLKADDHEMMITEAEVLQGVYRI